jgi:hypothetical protein
MRMETVGVASDFSNDPPLWCSLLALNSPRFSYVTGQSFLIDGGMFGAVTRGQPAP